MQCARVKASQEQLKNKFRIAMLTQSGTFTKATAKALATLLTSATLDDDQHGRHSSAKDTIKPHEDHGSDAI